MKFKFNLKNCLVITLAGLLSAVVLGYVILRVWAATAPTPPNLGITNGQLAPCPTSPNCVTTQTGLPPQLMPALRYVDSPAEAQARLKALVLAQSRTTLITEREGYLHFEFRSAAIGFIDDVEFQFDADGTTIHFRSASRLGRGDGGVNRNRLQMITEAWENGP